MTDPTPDVSITDWHRLVPYPRDKTLTSGARAEVHDPLWLLGRQWQAGEFQGEDAGTPVRVQAWVDEDKLDRVDVAPGEGTDPLAYDPHEDGPLEAIVEREPVTDNRAGRLPSRELAAEAGRFLLALIDDKLDEGPYAPRAFDEDYWLKAPEDDEASDASGERFLDVMRGRSLDGHAVYTRLTEISDISTVEDDEEVSWSTEPPRPDGLEGGEVYESVLRSFVEWYEDLYDEPAVEASQGDEPAWGSAWDPSRLEYRFRVRAGEGEDATWFSARGYPGGRLDRDAFLAEGPRNQDPASNPGTLPPVRDLIQGNGANPDVTAMPSQMRFPGQPSTRWWAFEDGDVNLGAITSEPGEPGKLLATEYALLYGNDWFSFPLDVELGSLARIEKLLVTDTFGIVTEVPPVSRTSQQDGPGVHETGSSMDANPLGHALKGAGCWNLFAHATPDGHALLVPPVLGAHHESDPVERVVLARDEMANMAFGIELKTEGPLGDPITWEQHRRATLTLRGTHPSDDPEEEHIVLFNPGRTSLDLEGWRVEAGDVETSQAPPAYTFGEGPARAPVLGPGEQVTLHTGSGTPVDGHRYWNHQASPEGSGETASIWNRAASLTIHEPEDGADPSQTRLVEKVLLTGDEPAQHERYRLVSDVHENWFPLPMVDDPSSGSGVIGDRRFELGVLVDTDMQTAMPAGWILEPELSLHEEELTRVGVEMSRTYQYTRWLDGATHLWSGRRAGPGRGEGASGLRYDFLDEPGP